MTDDNNYIDISRSEKGTKNNNMTQRKRPAKKQLEINKTTHFGQSKRKTRRRKYETFTEAMMMMMMMTSTATATAFWNESTIDVCCFEFQRLVNTKQAK